MPEYVSRRAGVDPHPEKLVFSGGIHPIRFWHHIRLRPWLTTRRIVKFVLLSAVLMVGGAVLMVQRRPDWYQPFPLDEKGLERARIEATQTWDRISWQIVQAQPFEVLLTDHALTQWLTALLHHRPEFSQRFPKWLREPALSFARDEIRISAHVESGGWRAVLTVGLRLSVSPDGRQLQMSLGQMYLGSLPIPRTLVENRLQPWIDRRLESDREKKGLQRTRMYDQWSISQLMAGVTIPNDFIWPNGQRPVRVGSIVVRHGRLQLSLDPSLSIRGTNSPSRSAENMQ